MPTSSPAVTEVLGERERGFPEPAADVEQSFALGQVELVSLPCPEPARRVPAGGPVHRGEEHRDVRILIHPLVAEPMRVLCRHGTRVRRGRDPRLGYSTSKRVHLHSQTVPTSGSSWSATCSKPNDTSTPVDAFGPGRVCAMT